MGTFFTHGVTAGRQLEMHMLHFPVTRPASMPVAGRMGPKANKERTEPLKVCLGFS